MGYKMGLISYDAKEIMLEKIKDFNLSEEEVNKRIQMRNEFVAAFNNEKISQLIPEEYFPGLGKKQDCIGYQLEWGTIPLGSIKGGSMAKFGPQEQFEEIRDLLVDLTSFNDDVSEFYESGGKLTKTSKKLITRSQGIRGMKSGRTVLGKLLSIYYPSMFIPLFTDQDYLLDLILKNYSADSTGLESYMKNNFLFLQIRDELLSETAFLKYMDAEEFTNDHFYKFLYFCFPRAGATDETKEKKERDESFEALETAHYQKLVHRNFRKLFKNYRYVDEEVQNTHEGRYVTEDAGTMDFLCVDERENFVVIELKRKGTDETLGQLCRYMGWVRENLAKGEQKVCGLIISETKDIKLEYAIKVVPNVKTKQMRLNVAINDF